jgi:cupin fold WbuC family metalloprotein
MIKTISESQEVLYSDEDVIHIKNNDLSTLKKLALENERKRIRLCTHKSSSENVHEMLIFHAKDCYVRPHKHLNKSESMIVLEGEADMILFEKDGAIRSIVNMGPLESGKTFYQRVAPEIFHMLIIRTEHLFFHEVTEGPFVRNHTFFPDWAPEESSKEASLFLQRMNLVIQAHASREFKL